MSSYVVIDKLTDSPEFVEQVYDSIITFKPDLSYNNPVIRIEDRAVPQAAVRPLREYMRQTEFSLTGEL